MDVARNVSFRRGRTTIGAFIGAFIYAATSTVACLSTSPSSAPDASASTDPAPSLGGAPISFPEDASLGARAHYVLGGCVGGPETSCHGRGAGGMFLPDGTPTNLIGIPSMEDPSVVRVKRGDPANSYLYLKLIGGPGIDGGRMPLGQDPLDARALQAMAEWIEAGAPDP